MPPVRIEQNSYRLGPFRLLSELSLPRLAPSSTLDGPQVTISLAETVPAPFDAVALSRFLAVTPTTIWLDLPGTARYLIREGNRVTVQIHPGAVLDDVRGYLTAWVFGALCHQHGLLPLHASAVRGGGRVTAFVADSGAGKSTLVAALQQRGHLVVADDICLLDCATRPPRVLPVAPWIKLHRDAADLLGQSFTDADRTFSDEEKFRIPLAQPAEHAADLTLANLVFITRDPAAPAPTLTPLRGSAALGRLLEKIYLGHIAEAAGIERRLFEQTAATLAHASAYVLTVPPGLGRLGETMDLLEPLLRA